MERHKGNGRELFSIHKLPDWKRQKYTTINCTYALSLSICNRISSWRPSRWEETIRQEMLFDWTTERTLMVAVFEGSRRVHRPTNRRTHCCVETEDNPQWRWPRRSKEAEQWMIRRREVERYQIPSINEARFCWGWVVAEAAMGGWKGAGTIRVMDGVSGEEASSVWRCLERPSWLFWGVS